MLCTCGIVSLLPSQKAQIYTVLKEQADLLPEQFKWEVVRTAFRTSLNIDMLKMPNTQFYYKFEHTGDEHYAIFSPGYDLIREERNVETWNGQLRCFLNWCEFLKREMTTPDPWADIERQTVSFDLALSDDTPRSPFTVKEHAQVSKTLQAIEGLLLDFSAGNKDAQAGIRSEIKKLSLAAESQDRKTWFFAIIGFIASTAVSLALAPEQTKQLYQLLKAGLSGVITLVG